jgi:hypothetical protein
MTGCGGGGGRRSVVEFRSMESESREEFRNDGKDEQARQAEGETGSSLFAPKAPVKDEMPVNAWMIAGLVVLVIVGVLVVMGRKKPAASPNTVLPLDAYAAQLPVSQLAMSESSSLSGGKSTFLDGHIGNTGTNTVTGVTVQVLFHNDEAMPPMIETLPLALIRTHEPYVDTEPVSAAPLKPGDDQEFRLIFESVPTNWNTQMPEIHIIKVVTK